jgi:hypothetical protein
VQVVFICIVLPFVESLTSARINATASGAPSVGSSPAFFVTEMDFAHLAAILLSIVNEAHHSVLSCPAIPQRPIYVHSHTNIFVSRWFNFPPQVGATSLGDHLSHFYSSCSSHVQVFSAPG